MREITFSDFTLEEISAAKNVIEQLRRCSNLGPSFHETLEDTSSVLSFVIRILTRKQG